METFTVSRTKTSWKFEEKIKKKSNEFQRNKIKLIKLKNRKKENMKFQKSGKEFKEKLRGTYLTNWYKIIPKHILGQCLRTKF